MICRYDVVYVLLHSMGCGWMQAFYGNLEDGGLIYVAYFGLVVQQDVVRLTGWFLGLIADEMKTRHDAAA